MVFGLLVIEVASCRLAPLSPLALVSRPKKETREPENDPDRCVHCLSTFSDWSRCEPI